jgi:hypothetical protein
MFIEHYYYISLLSFLMGTFALGTCKLLCLEQLNIGCDNLLAFHWNFSGFHDNILVQFSVGVSRSALPVCTASSTATLVQSGTTTSTRSSVVPATSPLPMQTNATVSATHVSTTYHVPRGEFNVNKKFWKECNKQYFHLKASIYRERF